MPPSRRAPFVQRQIDRFQADPASLRNATILTITVTVVVVLIGSVVIWLFGGKDYPDLPTAVWFTLQTITTVGYGDVTPDTAFGRVVAGAVMVVAIGFTTIITALITSTFVDAAQRKRRAADQARQDERNESIDQRMTEIAQHLTTIEARLDQLGTPRVERES
ncbi:MAG TPA: potassium channel family protein [Candidatus Limnocylindrales bacterium]|nr:potassium channel family protein [Candidatus Limnocylindrales bacterium]